MPLNVVLKQAEAYRVAGVSCGGGHSGLVYSDGSAYTFGRGEQGQLGHGVTLSEATPRKVTELQGVRMKRLSCGAQHTLFLSAQVTRALVIALALTLIALITLALALALALTLTLTRSFSRRRAVCGRAAAAAPAGWGWGSAWAEGRAACCQGRCLG